MKRSERFALSALLLGLSGCPVTDDYYLEASSVETGGESTGGQSTSGGSSVVEAGEASVAGSPAIVANEGGAATGGAAANSPVILGCEGFAIAGQPDHQYAYCQVAKTWSDARDACVAEGMRLLWLESEAENLAVSEKLAELGDDMEVVFGANDLGKEGDWCWGPSEPFWKGNGDGEAVGDAFTAWTEGVPNDDNGGEDCGVLYPESATWGDKGCDQPFPYVCEPLD